jgi:hypothetical protein
VKRHIGTGLLDCLKYCGIPHCVDRATKKRIRNLIVNDREYPQREPAELEWYSRSDGDALKALAEKLYPKTDDELAHAIYYGEYCKALSRIVGYPADIPLLDRIRANVGAMAWVLKKEANAVAEIYDNRGILKKSWLQAEAAKLGLDWVWTTPVSGEIATDKKTMAEAVDACPAFAPLASIVLEIGNLKNFTVDESPGGFHTPRNIPLQSATLRTQSSGLLFLAKWFRGLVLVPPGFVLIHADFKAEELHISAKRSDDANMLKAVAGDPHLKLAIEAGLIPADGTAETHHVERARAKICNFRILYGEAGLALWKRAHSEYDISDVAGVEMLLLACQSLDRAEALRAQIDVDGEVIRLRNGTIRSHPALRDEVACRAFLVRTISRLGLNFEPLRSSPGRPPNVG